MCDSSSVGPFFFARELNSHVVAVSWHLKIFDAWAKPSWGWSRTSVHAPTTCTVTLASEARRTWLVLPLVVWVTLSSVINGILESKVILYMCVCVCVCVCVLLAPKLDFLAPGFVLPLYCGAKRHKQTWRVPSPNPRTDLASWRERLSFFRFRNMCGYV